MVAAKLCQLGPWMPSIASVHVLSRAPAPEMSGARVGEAQLLAVQGPDRPVSVEHGAHGADFDPQLGRDGRCAPRHGCRPPLRRRRLRTRIARQHKTIRRGRPAPLREVVGGCPRIERPRMHREHAAGSGPSVVVHARSYRPEHAIRTIEREDWRDGASACRGDLPPVLASWPAQAILAALRACQVSDAWKIGGFRPVLTVTCYAAT